MKRKYHGWIYRQEEEGKNDSFYISHGGISIHMGYSASGAERAVAFFETPEVEMSGHKYDGLNLGHIKLEDTPIGLRVYTEEAEP